MLKGHNDTILMLEYWSNDGDKFWDLPDDEVLSLAKKEIYATSLVPAGSVQDGKVIKLHRSYPVYAKDYNRHLKVVQKGIDDVEGLVCIGRNGSFKYNNQDHSILMGILAAENLTGVAAHDLWSVNTDYDYQEGKSQVLEQSISNSKQ